MGLNALQLIEHAERLIAQPPGASGRAATEEDLRRAISAAYYAVFHTTVAEIAGLFFSAPAAKNSAFYERIYRTPNHKEIKDCWSKYRTFCELKKIQVDAELQKFADSFRILYEKRSDADYNPTILITVNDARTSVGIARDAIERFRNADAIARNAFLSMILTPPKSGR